MLTYLLTYLPVLGAKSAIANPSGHSQEESWFPFYHRTLLQRYVCQSPGRPALKHVSRCLSVCLCMCVWVCVCVCVSVWYITQQTEWWCRVLVSVWFAQSMRRQTHQDTVQWDRSVTFFSRFNHVRRACFTTWPSFDWCCHSIVIVAFHWTVMAGAVLTVTSFLTLFHISSTQTRQQGSFPAVFDVSRDQQVLSEPSSAVCGLPTASAFCSSTTSVTSVRQCRLVPCTGQCPTRTATPSHVDLLLYVRSATCVVRDDVNVHPHSSHQHAFSVKILRSVALSDHTQCYIRPPVKPTLGADGSFTFTFWVWINSNNSGSVPLFDV